MEAEDSVPTAGSRSHKKDVNPDGDSGDGGGAVIAVVVGVAVVVVAGAAAVALHLKGRSGAEPWPRYSLVTTN